LHRLAAFEAGPARLVFYWSGFCTVGRQLTELLPLTHCPPFLQAVTGHLSMYLPLRYATNWTMGGQWGACQRPAVVTQSPLAPYFESQTSMVSFVQIQQIFLQIGVPLSELFESVG
jgi:hypothetical protein